MENAHNNTAASGMGSKEFTLLVALLMSITAISIDALLPALGIIGNELNAATANQPQLLISMLFLGLAVGQLICGPLSDALGRRPILFGGFALYLVGTVICYQADSLEILMLGRFIQGLGVAGPYISAISLVRDLYHGAQMARIMSLVMMIFVLVPAIALALGQAIGRWGNYFNQELYGLPTDKSLGIPIEIARRVPEYYNYEFFHPTFLYESMGNLVIFGILFFLHKRFIKKNIKAYALILALYLFLYSLLRFSLEFVRIDKTPELFGLRFPQIASIILMFVATYIFYKNKKAIGSLFAKNNTEDDASLNT